MSRKKNPNNVILFPILPWWIWLIAACFLYFFPILFFSHTEKSKFIDFTPVVIMFWHSLAVISLGLCAISAMFSLFRRSSSDSQKGAGTIQQRNGPNIQDSSGSSTAPACPSCGKTMVLRTARKGTNAGSQFWGCRDYPDCRGFRKIER